MVVKKKKRYKIKLADNLDILRKMKDNTISAVISDPPYGLSQHKTKDIEEALKCWLAGKEYETKQKGGFMGKSWDAFVPGPEVWKEIYRVLKPGGYLLCFAGTRTQDLMGISIRLAGFEYRDEVSILCWNYGSGFPKSRAIGKAIDKEAGIKREVVGRKSGERYKYDFCDNSGKVVNTRDADKTIRRSDIGLLTAPVLLEAEIYEGYGTALKPSHEPILIFRKPLSEKTVAKNVLKHGTGGINVDGCRVGTEDILQHGGRLRTNSGDTRTGAALGMFQDGTPNTYQQNPSGRWPPNILLVHSPGCRKIGTKKVKNPSGSVSGKEPSEVTKEIYGKFAGRKKFKKHGDKEGKELVEVWDCVEGCPVKEMDRQSGIKTSGAMKHTVEGYDGESVTGFLRGRSGPHNQHGGTGGASRFFPQFQYCGKANKKEKNEGLPEGMKNTWPTVKPVKLMRWLVRLVTPPNGIVLDPFMGTGTTGIACLKEGFRFLGIEKDPEAFEIAKKRLEHAAKKKSV